VQSGAEEPENPRINLRNLDRAALAAAVAPLGVGADVASRIFARVHRDGTAGFAPESVRGLSNAAVASLSAACEWPDLEVLDRRRSEDGFLKYLFKTPDGREIEAVRIPLPDPAAARALKERRRSGLAAPLEALPTAKYTVCLSSQVGCALACDFCATGRLGGIRSLKTWEILAQLRIIAREADHPVRGVVFMGMGEPMLNYENVIRAARIMSDPAGPAIAAKAISISTAGVLPAIRRFTAEGHHYRLILSLGAPTSEERRRLMPIEDRWPLAEVMAAMRDHAAARGQRVTLAYVVIGGVNATPAHARALGALIGDLRVKLNLIDVTDDTGRYRRATPDELAAFRDALDALGVPVVRRYSGGSDIGAACGTLAATRRGGRPAIAEPG
jgi:23S rRNA (adenine2503-C2)-methyltransferase